MPRTKKHLPHPGYTDVHLGADITLAAAEFGRAVDRYKRSRQRPFPAFTEILEVVTLLGYRKVPAPFESWDELVELLDSLGCRQPVVRG